MEKVRIRVADDCRWSRVWCAGLEFVRGQPVERAAAAVPDEVRRCPLLTVEEIHADKPRRRTRRKEG